MMQFLKNYNILIIASSIIAAYFFILKFISGLSGIPREGDSIYYHIPYAQKILSGNLLISDGSYMDYLTGIGEFMLAFLIALHIPVTLYNFFALILLFFSMLFLGKSFKLSNNSSLMLSLAVCTLYDILRYINDQKIDIWLLVFYVLSLGLIQNPKKSLIYFLKLGMCMGLVIGLKYNGVFFILILILIYTRSLLKFISIKRTIAFIIPFIIFGLSWYARNIINYGNPFWPQTFLFFKGDPSYNLYEWPYWRILINFPKEMLNALISEYMIWILTIPFVSLILFLSTIKKKIKKLDNKKLYILAILNFIYFIFLPCTPAHNYTAIVFDIRYSLPALVTLMLATFYFAEQMKKSDLIITIAFANISFLMLPIPYYPKLLFVYVPTVTFFIYLLKEKISPFLVKKL